MSPRVKEGRVYFSQDEAASRLGVSQQAVSKAIRQERLETTPEGIEAGELTRYMMKRRFGDVVDPGVKPLLVWLLAGEVFPMIPQGHLKRDPIGSMFTAYLRTVTGEIFDYDPEPDGLIYSTTTMPVRAWWLAPWLVRARGAGLSLANQKGSGPILAEELAQLLLLYFETFGDEVWEREEAAGKAGG